MTRLKKIIIVTTALFTIFSLIPSNSEALKIEKVHNDEKVTKYELSNNELDAKALQVRLDVEGGRVTAVIPKSDASIIILPTCENSTYFVDDKICFDIASTKGLITSNKLVAEVYIDHETDEKVTIIESADNGYIDEDEKFVFEDSVVTIGSTDTKSSTKTSPETLSSDFRWELWVLTLVSVSILIFVITENKKDIKKTYKKVKRTLKKVFKKKKLKKIFKRRGFIATIGIFIVLLITVIIFEEDRSTTIDETSALSYEFVNGRGYVPALAPGEDLIAAEASLPSQLDRDQRNQLNKFMTSDKYTDIQVIQFDTDQGDISRTNQLVIPLISDEVSNARAIIPPSFDEEELVVTTPSVTLSPLLPNQKVVRGRIYCEENLGFIGGAIVNIADSSDGSVVASTLSLNAAGKLYPYKNFGKIFEVEKRKTYNISVQGFTSRSGDPAIIPSDGLEAGCIVLGSALVNCDFSSAEVFNNIQFILPTGHSACFGVDAGPTALPVTPSLPNITTTTIPIFVTAEPSIGITEIAEITSVTKPTETTVPTTAAPTEPTDTIPADSPLPEPSNTITPSPTLVPSDTPVTQAPITQIVLDKTGSENNDGFRTWVGQVQGSETESFLTVKGDKVYGTVNTNNQMFAVLPLGDGYHALAEYDYTAISDFEEEDSFLRSADGAGRGIQAVATPSSNQCSPSGQGDVIFLANTPREKVETVIQAAYDNDINPFVLMGYWATESYFGQYGNPNEFNCFKTGVDDFESSLQCFVDTITKDQDKFTGQWVDEYGPYCHNETYSNSDGTPNPLPVAYNLFVNFYDRYLPIGTPGGRNGLQCAQMPRLASDYHHVSDVELHCSDTTAGEGIRHLNHPKYRYYRGMLDSCGIASSQMRWTNDNTFGKDVQQLTDYVMSIVDYREMTCGAPDDGSHIEIMTLYTPAVLEAMGGEEEVLLMIENSFQTANNILTHSGINTEFVNVSNIGIAYEEQSTTRDINNLTGKNDGFMDGIHQTRDFLKADVVFLLTNRGAGCGIAQGVFTNAENAFVLSEYDCAPAYTLPHEVGHIFGAWHNKEASIHPYAGNTTHPFDSAYGGVGVGSNIAYRTIMSYWKGPDGDVPCDRADFGCVVLGNFSDGATVVNDIPVGREGETHNRDFINGQLARVANFRRWNEEVVIENTPTPFPTADVTAASGTEVPTPTPGECLDIEPQVRLYHDNWPNQGSGKRIRDLEYLGEFLGSNRIHAEVDLEILCMSENNILSPANFRFEVNGVEDTEFRANEAGSIRKAIDFPAGHSEHTLEAFCSYSHQVEQCGGQSSSTSYVMALPSSTPTPQATRVVIPTATTGPPVPSPTNDPRMDTNEVHLDIDVMCTDGVEELPIMGNIDLYKLDETTERWNLMETFNQVEDGKFKLEFEGTQGEVDMYRFEFKERDIRYNQLKLHQTGPGIVDSGNNGRTIRCENSLSAFVPFIEGEDSEFRADCWIKPSTEEVSVVVHLEDCDGPPLQRVDFEDEEGDEVIAERICRGAIRDNDGFHFETFGSCVEDSSSMLIRAAGPYLGYSQYGFTELSVGPRYEILEIITDTPGEEGGYTWDATYTWPYWTTGTKSIRVVVRDLEDPDPGDRVLNVSIKDINGDTPVFADWILGAYFDDRTSTLHITGGEGNTPFLEDFILNAPQSNNVGFTFKLKSDYALQSIISSEGEGTIEPLDYYENAYSYLYDEWETGTRDVTVKVEAIGFGEDPEGITRAPQGVCGSIDVDNNGELGLVDLAEFSNNYNNSCVSSFATNDDTHDCGNIDSNGDGKVDIYDFLSFAERYNSGQCSL